jgi:hypothetical protein
LAKGVSAKILNAIYIWFMNFRISKIRLNKFKLGYVTLSWFRLG